MPVKIQEDTRQQYIFSKHCGDIIIDANTTTTSSVVYNETVPVIGNWTDYTGSAVVSSSNQQMFTAVENRLFGTVADIEGNAKLPNLNEVGEIAATTRRRRRKIYHEIR